MEDSYRKQIGIDPSHIVTKIDDDRENRKGQDSDFYQYNVHASDGTLVDQLEIKDSTGTFPPNRRTVTFRSLLDPSRKGTLIPD